MKGFEPYVDPLAVEDQIDALMGFSDVQLLMELRRRKVLARVDYHNIVPGYVVSSGYPQAEQVRKAYDGIAHELTKVHFTEYQPPGCKVELGQFMPGPYEPKHPDRKVKLVLNYVVEQVR